MFGELHIYVCQVSYRVRLESLSMRIRYGLIITSSAFPYCLTEYLHKFSVPLHLQQSVP